MYWCAVCVGSHEAPYAVVKLFGGGEEPEDATNDDGLLLSTDDERFDKVTGNSSSFARTVSSSNDSAQSDDDDNEEDAEKRDDNNNNNNSPKRATVINETSVSNNMNVEEWESLQNENEQLQRQVADLTSALVVRDMEIASLRERCQHLMTSVEQQDEVIAKIYAATSDSPPKSTANSRIGTVNSSDPVNIPAQAARVPADVHKHKRSQGFLQVVESPNKSHEVTNKHSNTKTLESLRRYPGVEAPVEPARELLEARLDSIGYQQQKANDAIESLSKESAALKRAQSLGDEVENLSVGMLDRLLFPSPPKNEPLFGDSGGIFKSGPRSVVPSPDISFRKALPPQSPFMERRGSITSEEDFAKSAGFLRKSNRKLSGRLSVSDFGLLGDDTQLFGHSAGSSSSHSSNQPEDGSDADAAGGSSLSKRNQRRTSSQRNLFGEIDVALNEEATRKKEKQKAASASAEKEKQEDELTYAQFLERISLPGSRDILDSIRKFVGSILGPRGDGKPPRSSDYLDYDFYGNHEFQRRYEYFFQKMDETLQSHSAWRHASETMLSKARDGIEKYVMDKLFDIAFNQLPQCQPWKKEDDKLFRRMKLLSVRVNRLFSYLYLENLAG